jgi:hypothetical protein
LTIFSLSAGNNDNKAIDLGLKVISSKVILNHRRMAFLRKIQIQGMFYETLQEHTIVFRKETSEIYSHNRKSNGDCIGDSVVML